MASRKLIVGLQRPSRGWASAGSVLFIVSTFLTASFPIGSRAAFLEPNASPPQNNVVEPLNVSVTTQTRLGPLRIGDASQAGVGAQPLQVAGGGSNVHIIGNLTVGGTLQVGVSPQASLYVAATNIGIGTTTPSASAKVDVQAGAARGVDASSRLATGSAIYAYTTNAAPAGTPGIDAQTSFAGGTAAFGQNTDVTNVTNSPSANVGVYGYTLQSSAVYGKTTGSTVTSYGVAGYASTSATDIGVFGSDGQYGVSGIGPVVAVWGTATGSSADPNAGVYAQKPSNGSDRYSLFVEAPWNTPGQPLYSGYFAGPVKVKNEVIAAAFQQERPVAGLASFTAGQKIAEAAVGSKPHGLAFDGQYLWVANENEGGGGTASVQKIRPSDGAVLQTITDATKLPNPHALVFDGTSLWVGNRSAAAGNAYVKIRPSDGAILSNCGTRTLITSLVFDGTSVWAGAQSLFLDQINPSTCTIATTALASFSLAITTLGAISYDGVYIWVPLPEWSAMNRVRLTSPFDQTYVCIAGTTCASDPNIRPVASAFDGQFLWILGAGSSFPVRAPSLTKVRPSDASPTPLDQFTFSAGSGCNSMLGADSILFDGMSLWVNGGDPGAGGTGDLFEIRSTDGQRIGCWDFASGHAGLAFDGTFVWSSQMTLNKVYKVFSGQGFGTTDLRHTLQLQTISPVTAQVGNVSVSGNYATGGDTVVTGDLSANANTFGAGVDVSVNQSGVQTTSCAAGSFVASMATGAANYVLSIRCSTL